VELFQWHFAIDKSFKSLTKSIKNSSLNFGIIMSVDKTGKRGDCEALQLERSSRQPTVHHPTNSILLQPPFSDPKFPLHRYGYFFAIVGHLSVFLSTFSLAHGQKLLFLRFMLKFWYHHSIQRRNDSAKFSGPFFKERIVTPFSKRCGTLNYTKYF